MMSTGTFRDEFDFLDQHVPEALYADWNDPINTFFTSTLLEWVRENQYQSKDDYHKVTRFAELILENDFQERPD